MNNRAVPLGLFIAGSLLVTGCDAAEGNAGRPGPASLESPFPAPSPRASKPAKASTAVKPPGRQSINAGAPSNSTKMICSPETAGKVATSMGLNTAPRANPTWADRLYTCSYRTPAGPVVLFVKESPDVAAARGYFNGLRKRLGSTQPLTGLVALGLPAFEKTNGTVVFLKDNMTLRVDTTGLPPRVGPQNSSRADLGYAIATTVLACWTGK